LSDENRLLRDTVRKFADDRLRPHIRDWFEDGSLPARDLALEFGALGVLGMHLTGYGCAARPPRSTASPAPRLRPSTPGCVRW